MKKLRFVIPGLTRAIFTESQAANNLHGIQLLIQDILFENRDPI